MKNHEAELLNDQLTEELKDHRKILSGWQADIDRCNALQSENDTLRTRLEAVEKDLEEQRIVNKELNKPIQDVCLAGRHGMKSYVELEDMLTKLEKANGELVSRIEQALAHLVEAGSNKKHDPSWIRPMTMTRKEVNDACIQAYHQLQTCLEALKGEG